MKFMQKPVDGGRENQPDQNDKSQPAEESITARKNFPALSMQFGHRTHPGQNHRRIDEGVRPAHFLETVVAEHARSQANRHQPASRQRMSGHARIKCPARQERPETVFVHGLNAYFPSAPVPGLSANGSKAPRRSW